MLGLGLEKLGMFKIYGGGRGRSGGDVQDPCWDWVGEGCSRFIFKVEVFKIHTGSGVEVDFEVWFGQNMLLLKI